MPWPCTVSWELQNIQYYSVLLFYQFIKYRVELTLKKVLVLTIIIAIISKAYRRCSFHTILLRHQFNIFIYIFILTFFIFFYDRLTSDVSCIVHMKECSSVIHSFICIAHVLRFYGLSTVANGMNAGTKDYPAVTRSSDGSAR